LKAIQDATGFVDIHCTIDTFIVSSVNTCLNAVLVHHWYDRAISSSAWPSKPPSSCCS
jgi:hypothetical protein